MTRPTEEQIKTWCKALRSGKYNQIVGVLNTPKGFCCLGVACDVFIPIKDLELKVNGLIYGSIPIDQPNVPDWLKDIDYDFFKLLGSSLMELNDTDKLTFDEIADCLEAVFIHKVLDTMKFEVFYQSIYDQHESFGFDNTLEDAKKRLELTLLEFEKRGASVDRMYNRESAFVVLNNVNYSFKIKGTR